MDDNCLSFWYPKIKDVVPTPKTHWVKVSDGHRLIELTEGKVPDVMHFLSEALKEMVRMIGGRECFLRTGQGSGKHDWSNCCHVVNSNRIENHICRLVEWSHLVSLLGLPHDVWVVREMLPTQSLFKCTAYGGMPVVREWRYFVEDGEILYGIPYWPEDALEQGQPDVENWRDSIWYLHAEPPDEVAEMARMASRKVRGKWSIDLLDTANGWYVTDMAVAEQSYGWREDGESVDG